jgi:hypothetical protein
VGARARTATVPRTQGRDEGRDTRPFEFDCVSYLGRYPDVLSFVGPNCQAAEQHYVQSAEEGRAEPRTASLDLNVQVYPLCSTIPGRCVMSGDVLREANYRISRDRCVRPANANIPAARLADLVRRGESSPHFSDGSFLSCQAGVNTFADPPKVDYPGCRDRGENCLLPGGHQKDGQRYVLPNGRCLRAIGNCLGCLGEEQGNDTLLEKNRANFESCELNRDTTNIYTSGDAFYWPACRTEGPTCERANGAQINNARYYTMYKGRPRCVRAVGECAGCLNVIHAHDRIPDQWRSAFASCEPNKDTTDRTNQTGFTGAVVAAPSCYGNRCLEADGRQRVGYQYTLNGRCVRALTDCKGCLDVEMNSTDKRIKRQHHSVFGSCNPVYNTTKYQWYLNMDQNKNES